MQVLINSLFEYSQLDIFFYLSLVLVNQKTNDLINSNYWATEDKC